MPEQPKYCIAKKDIAPGTFEYTWDCCVDGHQLIEVTQRDHPVTGCPAPGGGGGSGGRTDFAGAVPLALPTWILPGQHPGPRLALSFLMDWDLMATPPDGVIHAAGSPDGSSPYSPVGLYPPGRTAAFDVAVRIPASGDRPALVFTPLLWGPRDFGGLTPVWIPVLDLQRETEALMVRSADGSIRSVYPQRVIDAARFSDADFARPGPRVTNVMLPDPAAPDRQRSIPFLLPLRAWRSAAV